MNMREVYPGVLAGVFDQGKEGVYVPVVISKQPGCGNVGRFIEHLLGEHKMVKFPNVINPQLQQMLMRRGFKLTYEYAEVYGEYVDVWVREAEEVLGDE